MEQHFREHAELIDRRFAEVHARFAEIHARFTAQDKRFESIDRRVEAQDIAGVHDAVNRILLKLNAA